MPRTFKVIETATIERITEVTLEDEQLAEVAKDNEISVEDLTADDLEDVILDEVMGIVPGDLCAHCSGLSQKWSQEIGEWDVDEIEEVK
jgi:hypothetical protein